MLPLFKALWLYRAEILVAVEILQRLRKTAAETAREYIKRRAKQKLVRQLWVIGGQLTLFFVAYLWNIQERGLTPRLFGSAVLWGVLLYNLFDLVFFTIPELLEVRRVLRGKVGYTFKYLLGVSVVTELMEGNLLFLAFCVLCGLSGRTLLGSTFQFLAPWVQFFANL